MIDLIKSMVKLDLKLTCTISHGVLSQTIEPELSSFIIGYGTILVPMAPLRSPFRYG